MKKIILTILMIGSSVIVANGATIDYTGSTHSEILTGHPWIFGTTMWGDIDTGTGTGTSQTGLTTVPDASRLSWTFGDLELTNFLSPGPASAGFEEYTEGDLSVTPLDFFYNHPVNGVEHWATGQVDLLRVDVINNVDPNATGSGVAFLTGPGTDSAAFYNEVLSLTGGTGKLVYVINSFFSIAGDGNFGSTGTINIVPEPGTYAMVLGALILGFVFIRRRK